MTGEPAPVTVVVPTRDRPDLLRRCLEALRAELEPGDRLVVVDSHGISYDAGSWTLVPGKQIDFTAGTAVDETHIDRVLITLADGAPILQAQL